MTKWDFFNNYNVITSYIIVNLAFKPKSIKLKHIGIMFYIVKIPTLLQMWLYSYNLIIYHFQIWVQHLYPNSNYLNVK